MTPDSISRESSAPATREAAPPCAAPSPPGPPSLLPAHQGPSWAIYCGDAIEILRTLPAESVHCVVTSPPYWGLRDYSRCECAVRRTTYPHGGPPEHGADAGGAAFTKEPDPNCPRCHETGFDPIVKEKQIGLEETPGAYVARLVEVFREVRRVLRSDGTVWLNLGDSFAREAAKGQHKPGDLGKQAYIYDTGSGRDSATADLAACGLKPKDLVGIPWRVAFALQADGWWLRSDIIWSKLNPLPESVTDRVTRSHEYVFLLAKRARYYYDADTIREVPAPSTLARVALAETRPISGSSAHEYKRSSDARVSQDKFKDERDHLVCAPHPLGRNRRSVWHIATEPFPDVHFATFPRALVEPCIKAGCPPGGVVLDPFMGSGTAGVVALSLGRLFIGIDIKAHYCEMAARRIQGEKSVPLPERVAGQITLDRLAVNGT
jgi:DNA modification methylase